MDYQLHWHCLSEVRDGNGNITELMAAASDDGIGILASWERKEDGSWDVKAFDTEGQAWQTIVHFGEEEPVPPEPPKFTGVLSEYEDAVLEAAEANCVLLDASTQCPSDEYKVQLADQILSLFSRRENLLYKDQDHPDKDVREHGKLTPQIIVRFIRS